MLTKAEFMEATGLKKESVEVGGVGRVHMRELAVGERLDFRERYLGNGRSDADLSLALVALSLLEPDGSPMFAVDEIDDAVQVMKRKSLRSIESLQKAFLRINGLDEQAIEDAVGNSIEIPSGSSFSASLGISDTPQSGA